MDINELQFLLKKYQLTPNKVRGQNFLVSDVVLDTIIATAQVGKKDLILEVGPGLGALTSRLLENAGHVVAFEIEENFKALLVKISEISGRLEIIWQDILSLSDKQWQDILQKYDKDSYKIVANIPYYLTAKFINKFILSGIKPDSMTLMIQKEVAERIVDQKKHSLLSLSVAFYGQARLVEVVPKSDFYPQPKVDSAILHVFDIRAWSYQEDEKKTWQIVRRGFAFKRKKLINNLLSDPRLEKQKTLEIFDKIGLEKNIRAEKLTVKDWLNLSKHL